MNTLGVIPARYGSERFEGKVLADLAGKSVIQHVWDRAKQSRLLDDLVIACDDVRVEKKAKSFGAKVIMTSQNHASGSDRITEVLDALQTKAKIVVNIQGDEPLMDASMIDELIMSLEADETCPMATLIKRIKKQTELNNPNVVKVVVDKNHNALYFSRAPIPFNRREMALTEAVYYKHFGLYAYRKDFLFVFKSLPQGRAEKLEKLEQLRVLEAGYKIKTVETQKDTIGVDTPEDLQRAEELLKKELS